MKAVISNRIYLNCDKGSDLEQELSDILTYEIDQMPQSEYPQIIKNMIRITNNVVSIPSGRLDLIPEGYSLKDKRLIVDEYIPTPSFELREDQQACLDFFDGRSGIVNCIPGWGKSIMALAIAHKFQQKTLVVCTTTLIRDMWIKEVKKFFGFEPGVVGGGKFDIDPPIVIGNIQTVRNRTEELADKFGILILDEAHHCPATTFTDFLNSSKASIKLGLTGTLKRKDGMHCVFSDYFSTNVFVGKQENVMTPEVHLYDVDVPLNTNEFIPWANKVTELKQNPLYRKTVLALAKSYAALGHKVLVVSDRVEFLQYIHQNIKTSLIITGEINCPLEREKIIQAVCEGSANVLCATQSIFSEGTSVNPLSCIILATPINNAPLIEQLAGRVQRLMEGKLTPIIADIRLAGNTGRRQRYTRFGVYLDKGWPTKDYTISALSAEVNKKE